MSFVFSFGDLGFSVCGESVLSSVSSRLGKVQLFLSCPLFVADRRSGYVFVLVWFHLGTLRILFLSLFYLAYRTVCLVFVF